MTCWEMVREFHLKNGQDAPDQVSIPMPMKTTLLRQRLVLEELGETIVAFHEKNTVEMADGLTDLLYVIYGTAVSCGMEIYDFFIDEPTAKVSDEEVVSFMCEITRGIYDLFMALTCSTLDFRLIRHRFMNLIIFVNHLGSMHRFPMRDLFIEVHKSNMSKQLGGAKDGKKYGTDNPKGAGYQPPRIADLLKIANAI